MKAFPLSSWGSPLPLISYLIQLFFCSKQARKQRHVLWSLVELIQPWGQRLHEFRHIRPGRGAGVHLSYFHAESMGQKAYFVRMHDSVRHRAFRHLIYTNRSVLLPLVLLSSHFVFISLGPFFWTCGAYTASRFASSLLSRTAAFSRLSWRSALIRLYL